MLSFEFGFGWFWVLIQQPFPSQHLMPSCPKNDSMKAEGQSQLIHLAGEGWRRNPVRCDAFETQVLSSGPAQVGSLHCREA